MWKNLNQNLPSSFISEFGDTVLWPNVKNGHARGQNCECAF